ncbi:zinc finger, RING/FYVE/PHD-type containing protein [Tanacetum coccineum]|uniref:RING-type E3 ubiquitin transferase n=1 Tax=Tanacetum coccineum TaxID=301880 RepID=A0ABQ4ZCD4_9ASTR
MVSKHNNPVTIKTKKTSVLLFIFLFESIRGEDVCSPTFCSPGGPQIRFPFRLVGRQPSRCGFSGFDLTCNGKNQTILKLPSSRSLIVTQISYIAQEFNFDPDFCGPAKLSGIKLVSTPFEDNWLESYTFFNCSSEDAGFTLPIGPTITNFPCLGSVNHSVFAMQTSLVSHAGVPKSCKEITKIMVNLVDTIVIMEALLVLNLLPKASGISSLSIGIPGLVFLGVLLCCCISSKGRHYNQRQSQGINLLPTAVSRQPPSTTGLDRPTVESYPKTVWGESYELHKDNGTCAICLSDYKTKDAVRTIPECNHYFHVDCVDEWLKLNATCPVCRKYPASSSLVTPSSTLSSDEVCSPAFCSLTGPQVRFPFRIVDRQPSQCGFPGFDLSCNKKNQTILKLPSSRSFMVTSISYTDQVINVDPDFCGPERLAAIKIAYTPFEYTFYESYTFYNCSSQNVSSGIPTMPMIPFPCLGSVNHSVFAIKTAWTWGKYIPESCKEITWIRIPNNGYGDIRSWSEFSLRWFKPFCRYCEVNGKTCGFKNDYGETNCIASSSSSSNDGGISRGAKYGLSLGIGIPGLAFLIGLANYIIGKVGNYNQDQRQNIELLSNAISRRPPSTTGLDSPTIESYPKTVLGEDCELPKDHGTCAICLSDYKPKDAVRTIPECNHYFHADCIDEWLKINVTCPICRKSPQSSSLVTPCSSVSSSSLNSTNSSHTTTQ